MRLSNRDRLYDVLDSVLYHVDTHIKLSEQVQKGNCGPSALPATQSLFRLPYTQGDTQTSFTGTTRNFGNLMERGTQ